MDQRRSRLGRGLSSLLSQPSIQPTQETHPALPVMRELPVEAPASSQKPGPRYQLLPIGSIKPNPFQPRRKIDPKTVAELSASIRQTGVIQPIVVRPVGDGFELIAGERRWRAAQLAEQEQIPAIVRDADAASQAQMALVENIHRENLNPIDRASSYRTLMDQLGLTQSELSDRLGEDRSVIANFVRLLNLAEPVRQLVSDGQLSVGHGKLLAGLDDILEQQRLAELVVENGLSVRNLERLMEAPQPVTRVTAPPSAHLRDLATQLTTQLGMRTSLRAIGRKGAGQLTIHYGDLDQFDQIVQKLGIALPET